MAVAFSYSKVLPGDDTSPCANSVLQGNCTSFRVSLFLICFTFREQLSQGVSLFYWHTKLWKSSASYCSQKSQSRWWCQWPSLLKFAETTHQSWIADLSWDSESWLPGEHSQVQLCKAGKRKCRLFRNSDTYSFWISLAGIRLCSSLLEKCICVESVLAHKKSEQM